MQILENEDIYFKNHPNSPYTHTHAHTHRHTHTHTQHTQYDVFSSSIFLKYLLIGLCWVLFVACKLLVASSILHVYIYKLIL